MSARGDVLGPAKYALLGAALLTAGALAWHVQRLQRLASERDARPTDLPLDSLTLPRERVVVAAAPGAFPRLPVDPPTLAREEAEAARIGRGKFLVAGDPVIGVVAGGEARAYPLRLLDVHEVVNDTVGDVPLLVAWHPLSSAAGVYERRVGSSRLAFATSGALYESTQLLLDDRPEASLWSPLLGRAVAGPRRGEALRAWPCELTRWDLWRKAHPETRVLAPAKALERLYRQALYRNYRGSDELRFPVSKLPPPGLRRKEPVLVVRAGGERRVFPHALLARRVDAAGYWRTRLGGVELEFFYRPGTRDDDAPVASVRSLHGEPLEVVRCAWFAWFATHPDDAHLAVDMPRAHGQG
ncbi:MAG: DUF3179 domain-containing protein [Planctomycetota bacterium]|nr:MAG: DUF3179 domain-containing protein [Planctomycetota bacterium]